MNATAIESAKSSLNFASNLFSLMGNAKDNSFYSPFSLQVALGMCLAGANGETKDLLKDALSVNEEFNSYFKNIIEDANPKSDLYELTTANALWCQNEVELNKNYITNVENNYKGVINRVDFSHNSQEAINLINDWCNKNTNSKIPTIASSNNINETTVLALTNAIYFKGKWVKSFAKESTRKQPFYGVNEKSVDMMHNLERYSYFENEKYQVVDLPYKGDISMMIILPKDDNAVDLESAYNEAIAGFNSERVDLFLPKFKFETEYFVNKAFCNLGAALAFSDAADFSGISDVALKISSIVHKAFVEVDEEGTEAAAATMVGMMRCTSVRIEKPPKLFEANKPFTFCIHSPKNTILFAGRVTNL